MLIIRIIQFIGEKLKLSPTRIRDLQIIYIYYLNIISLIFSLITTYIFVFTKNDKYKFFALSSATYLLFYIDFSVFTTNLFQTDLYK
jgi:hypothetical protein